MALCATFNQEIQPKTHTRRSKGHNQHDSLRLRRIAYRRNRLKLRVRSKKSKFALHFHG